MGKYIENKPIVIKNTTSIVIIIAIILFNVLCILFSLFFVYLCVYYISSKTFLIENRYKNTWTVHLTSQTRYAYGLASAIQYGGANRSLFL